MNGAEKTKKGGQVVDTHATSTSTSTSTIDSTVKAHHAVACQHSRLVRHSFQLCHECLAQPKAPVLWGHRQGRHVPMPLLATALCLAYHVAAYAPGHALLDLIHARPACQVGQVKGTRVRLRQWVHVRGGKTEKVVRHKTAGCGHGWECAVGGEYSWERT